MLTPHIAAARKAGASDLHLEPGLPPGLRVRGQLSLSGEPVKGDVLLAMARQIVGDAQWGEFLARRSFDASRVIAGVQCRINVLQSARGVGLAVRLLASRVPTLASLNLHPSLASLIDHPHGLVLVCGPTGAGKSSTLAALVETINRGEPRHVVTIEQPIEYRFRCRRALIRQREVGRDTPSFEQGLLDALREDPDVLVVGEMRRRDTMQLTLDAAETGHLALATLHASSPPEALTRMVSAFPSDEQAAVRAQLADCLVAVVCQTLAYRARWKVRIPECAVLQATRAVRANIRDGAFFKLTSSMETGAADGMWTVERYRRWVDELPRVHQPADDPADEPDVPLSAPAPAVLPPIPAGIGSGTPAAAPTRAAVAPPSAEWVLDGDADLESVIAELKGR